jgi:predicted nucleotidyltransferase
MVKKAWRRLEYREVIYGDERWALLKRLRLEALRIVDTLEKSRLEAVVHGSVARGDVTQKSDVDVFIPYQVSSFLVETALEKACIPMGKRLVVQATPTYAMKAYVEIGENASVSFGLMKMRRVEREFYKFGGEISIKNLRDDLRIPGVDKRLMLVEPTRDGHKESAILGHEEQIAKLLGVSVETVFDRVHALLRRDEVGRTGVFIEKELSADETFEMALKRLADQNPLVRRRLTSLS